MPSYATSIEGGGMIVLSPDETKVLLVHELGRWVFPGGGIGVLFIYLFASFRVSKYFLYIFFFRAFFKP